MRVRYRTFQIEDNANNFYIVDSAVARRFDLPLHRTAVLYAPEKAKSLKKVEKIVKSMLLHGINRKGTVFAIGGGATLDVAGFVAAVYMRGVKLVRVPTTLLALIDAAVGDKTAVNCGGVKNSVGTFYEGEVIADYSLLSTCSRRQIVQGYGEIVKYSLLSEQIDKMYAFDGNLPSIELIKECINYKMSVVQADYRDKGARKVLNLGHTVGHALEVTKHLPHGIAVLHGIYYECALGFALGVITQPQLAKAQERVTQLCDVGGIGRLNKVFALCLADKKNDEGITLALWNGSYGATLTNVTEKEFKQLLESVC